MKVYDLAPGDLIQFSDISGPVPEMISEAASGWGESIRIESHFNWVWEERIVPRHMVYLGKRRKNGVLSYEVLWNNQPRLVKGSQIRHLERVVESEDIQVDGGAFTTSVQLTTQE